MKKIMDEPKKDFFGRADAHIHLSNDQAKNAKIGNVSASMLYGTSRFNAYAIGRNYTSAKDFKQDRDQAVDYLLDQYKKMLLENLDDYINNFEQYVNSTE